MIFTSDSLIKLLCRYGWGWFLDDMLHTEAFVKNCELFRLSDTSTPHRGNHNKVCMTNWQDGYNMCHSTAHFSLSPFQYMIELSKKMSAEWWCEYSRFMYCVVCVNRIPLRNLIWINRKVILFTSKFLLSGLIFSLKATKVNTKGLIISLLQSQWLQYAQW